MSNKNLFLQSDLFLVRDGGKKIPYWLYSNRNYRLCLVCRHKNIGLSDLKVSHFDFQHFCINCLLMSALLSCAHI